jgi:hypothetical protein
MKYYGKYRGVVAVNVDPLGIARIMALCPALATTPLSWALPAVPWGGAALGTFVVPPVGAGVWIEFEQGDIDYPIWSGCYWNAPEEVPAQAKALLAQPGIAIQGPFLNSIVLGPGDSGTGSVSLRCGDASIEMSGLGGIVMTSGIATITVQAGNIAITNGVASISLEGPLVSVNDGALDVL